MSKKPKIPEKEVIERHVAQIQEVMMRMDKHIADLDYLNARLEEEFDDSLYGQYCKRRALRLATSKE